MILRFPSIEAFQLALTSGVVAESVQGTPARLAIDQPALLIEPSCTISRAMMAELSRLGVEKKRSVKGDYRSLHCWHEAVPLSASVDAPWSDKTEVLFEISDRQQLATMVAEMLRLGNDRQSFRYLDEDGTEVALLRVTAPPYYTLLRALDGTVPGLRAFVQQSPRVWTQVGFHHPLGDRIKPAPGQWLLMDRDQGWRFVSEGQFRDIYSLLEFNLPDGWSKLEDQQPEEKIRVPLRLARGSTSESAELWVLTDHAMAQTEQLIRRSDDHVISELAFAVSTGAAANDGQPIVVIRARPSQHSPPILVLDGVAMRPYLKIPNLFLPVGRRLHPPLRRDAVAKMLASDGERIAWLMPQDEDSFIPHSIPDAAFRPLADWVDYVLDHDHQVLEAWMASHRFDFESFVCDQQPAKKTKKPAPPRNRDSDRDEPGQLNDDERSEKQRVKKKRPAKKKRGDAALKLAKPPTAKPRQDDLQQRLRELETAFRQSDDSLDSPQHADLWREMGLANSALTRRHDATICWVNSLWQQPSDADHWQQWLSCEQQCAGTSELTAETIDKWMASGKASSSHPTLIVSLLVWASAQRSIPDLVKERLGKLNQFLRRQENSLPIRAAWLAWFAMYRMSGDDVLLLAQARDRLLQRLFDQGLTPEFDMAGFMRTDGKETSDRFHVLRDQLLQLRDAANRWIEEPSSEGARTKSYADLMFTYALARLGETSQCNEMLAEISAGLLQTDDPLHAWVFDAYSHRVKQALAGDQKGQPLPAELLQRLESMPMFDRYKLEKLRSMSHILEPNVRINPYLNAHPDQLSGLDADILRLQNTLDPGELGQLIQTLVDKYPSGADHLRLLPIALQLSPSVGEQLACGLLEHVAGAIEHAEESFQLAFVLQKALFVAAHYGRIDFVHGFLKSLTEALPQIVADYLTLPDSNENVEKIHGIEPLFAQSFRGLRKLGMRSEIGDFYGQVAELAQQNTHSGRAATKKRDGRDGDLTRPSRLLLCVAGGWYYFGQADQARQVADQVRDTLLSDELNERGQQMLACAYLEAISPSEVDETLARVQELFAVNKRGRRKLSRIRDTRETRSHFSITQLEVIEKGVLSLVSEDFSLSDQARRWLDEDEFIVRSRIHRDVREAAGT